MSPWSPIPSLKKTMRVLIDAGYSNEASSTLIWRELKRQTGTIRDATLSKYVETMEEFNLIQPIKDKNGRRIMGVWRIMAEEEWEI